MVIKMEREWNLRIVNAARYDFVRGSETRVMKYSCEHRLAVVAGLTRGKLGIVVEGEDAEMAVGDVLFWRGGEAYDFLPEKGAVCRMITAFFVTREDDFPGVPCQDRALVGNADAGELPPELDALGKMKIFRRRSETIGSLERLRAAVMLRRPMWQNEADAALTLTLVRLLRGDLPTGALGRRDDLVGRIADCALNGCNCKETADTLHFSPNHLNKLTAAETGLTLEALLRRVRVRAACDLLDNTDAPVSEIAQTCGFSDASHFARVFAREVGATPGEYRAKRRGML